ncbi:MAG: hypothetical protein JWP18_2308, partial [Solirubrobacterales bacterium]|nr:hypothetical protein [Solirubrobacterales bacterium]
MRRALLLSGLLLVAATAGCGGGGDDADRTSSSASTSTGVPPPATTTNPTPRPVSGDVLVAALGDSITAGSPLYDPDPEVREQIGHAL